MWPITPTSHLQINLGKNYSWETSESFHPSGRNLQLDWMIHLDQMCSWAPLLMAPDTKSTLERLSKSEEELMITTPEGIPGVPPPLYPKNRVSKQRQGNLPALTVWYQMLLLISKRYSKGDSMKLHMFHAEISLLIITLRVWSHYLSHLTLNKWAHVNRSKLFLRIERVENMSRQIVVCMVRVPKRH